MAPIPPSNSRPPDRKSLTLPQTERWLATTMDFLSVPAVGSDIMKCGVSETSAPAEGVSRDGDEGIAQFQPLKRQGSYLCSFGGDELAIDIENISRAGFDTLLDRKPRFLFLYL